ncbi:hypothetical protein D3C75_1279730 [compost metagenome]
MTKYTSRYAELAFYVDGQERKFSGGVYLAKTDAEIAVLDRLVDVAKAEESAPQTEDSPKPSRKPAAAKTSAK